MFSSIFRRPIVKVKIIICNGRSSEKSCFFNCKMRDLVGRAEGRLTLGAVVVDGEEGVGRRGEVGVNTCRRVDCTVCLIQVARAGSQSSRIELVVVVVTSQVGVVTAYCTHAYCCDASLKFE